MAALEKLRTTAHEAAGPCVVPRTPWTCKFFLHMLCIRRLYLKTPPKAACLQIHSIGISLRRQKQGAEAARKRAYLVVSSPPFLKVLIPYMRVPLTSPNPHFQVPLSWNIDFHHVYFIETQTFNLQEQHSLLKKTMVL